MKIKVKIQTETLFKGQDKLKLVMPCRDDEYVIREWLIYKLYNLVTPKSFRTRLVRVMMEDRVKRKHKSFYGTAYIKALKKADAGDYTGLLAFAKS